MKLNYSYTKALYILIIFAFFAVQAAYGQAEASGDFQAILDEQLSGYNPDADGLTISEINVEKPKRTKISYLSYLIKANEGDVYTKELHANIYLNLWAADIFKYISIDAIVLPDNTVSLTILVIDKWTLIPFPIFNFSGSFLVGAYITESNFLGLGKYLSFVGTYGSDSYSLGFIYFDPQLFRSPFQLNVDSSVAIGQYEEYAFGAPNIKFKDINGNDLGENDFDPIRKSQGLLYNGGVGLGYLLPIGLVPNLRVSYYYFNNEIQKSETFKTTNNKYESSTGIPITAGLSFNLIRPYGLMQKGLMSKIEYTYSILSIPSSHSYSQGKFTAKYGFGLDAKKINLISVGVNAAYGSSPLIMAPFIGSSDTSRSISGTIKSNQYISGSLTHSIKLWEKAWGGIIFNYGGDMSLYKISDYEAIQEGILNGGVFGGIKFVFKAIKFPTVNLFYAYNISNEYSSFGINLGGF